MKNATAFRNQKRYLFRIKKGFICLFFLPLTFCAIFAQTTQPTIQSCNGDYCNLYCQGDFEAFLPMANAYYPQSGLTQFALNCSFANINTVDIVVDNLGGSVQNQFVCFGAAQSCEGLYFPLEESIPPGCFLKMEFRAAATTVATMVNVFGSTNPPCSLMDMNFNSGIPNPLCPTFTPHILNNAGIQINELAGASIILSPSDPNHPYPQYGESFIYYQAPVQFEDHCIVWQNNTNDPINFVTILHTNIKLYMDDISVTRYCNELLSASSSTGDLWCSNDGFNTVDYEICVDAEACVAPQIDMQASLPGAAAGIGFGVGGNFYPNGFLTMNITPGTCETVTLQIDLDETLITSEINLDVIMDITLSDNCYRENVLITNSVTVLLAGDEPDAEFTSILEDCETLVSFMSNVGPGFDHNWEFIDNATGLPIGTSIDENPTFDFINIGAYTVNHTISNECWEVTVSQNILIECSTENFTCPCEGANDLNIEAGNGTYIAQTSLPPNFLNNNSKCLAINGKLIINENYRISGGEIRMQPGAEIIVENGARLILFNIINDGGIHGCDIMWRGITVQPSSSLQSISNIIQDAQYAVNVVSASPLNASIDFFGNLFDRNHVGITTQIAGTLQSVDQINFRRNIFDSSSNLLPPFDQVDNYDPSASYAGIEVNAALLFIGVESESSSFNTFRNIRNGIVANSSYVHSYYSRFENIVGSYDIIQPATEGVGIVMNQSIALIGHNTFTDMDYGIGGRHSSCTVYDCEMNIINTGIDLQTPGNTDIEDNTIIAENTGIIANNVSGRGKFLIDVNDITLHTANNPSNNADEGIAVYGFGVFEEVQERLRIFDNDIHFDGSEAIGILLNGIGGFGIWDNDIDYDISGSSLFSGFRAGIELVSTDYNYLFNNTVISNTQIMENAGFEIWQSENNVFCCNSTNGLRRGLYFQGFCDGSMLRHTSIGSHDRGLLCVSATIGAQVDAGNMWNGSYSYQSAGHYSSFSQIQGSMFLVELPISPPLWPNNPISPNNPNWFQQSAGTSRICQLDPIGCPEPPEVNLIGNDDYVRDNDISLVNGDFLASDHGATETFEGSRSLFRRMVKYPSLLGQYTSIDGFYQSSLNSNISEFYDIENRIHQSSMFSTSKQQEVDSFWEAIDTLLFEIGQVESQFPFAQNQTDSLALFGQINYLKGLLVSPISSITDALAALTSHQASEAELIQADNENISVSSVYEQNRKTVASIYLETVAKGIFTFNATQRSGLEGIVWQCPLEGGDAVYWARSLYRLEADNYYNDEVLCTPPDALIGNGQSIQTTHELGVIGFTIHPNPANDKITVSLSQPTKETEMATHIQISTLDGKVMMEKGWDVNGKSLELSVKHLNRGIYFCSVFANDRRIATEKLVVVE